MVELLYISSGVVVRMPAMREAMRFQLSASVRSRVRPEVVRRLELCFSLIIGFAPHGGDETLVLEAEKRGIERTLLDGELIAGDLLDAEENSVTVERAQGDRLQDEHVEGPLHEIELTGHGFS
jgi:hypothetical protein